MKKPKPQVGGDDEATGLWRAAFAAGELQPEKDIPPCPCVQPSAHLELQRRLAMLLPILEVPFWHFSSQNAVLCTSSPCWFYSFFPNYQCHSKYTFYCSKEDHPNGDYFMSTFTAVTAKVTKKTEILAAKPPFPPLTGFHPLLQPP